MLFGHRGYREQDNQLFLWWAEKARLMSLQKWLPASYSPNPAKQSRIMKNMQFLKASSIQSFKYSPSLQTFQSQLFKIDHFLLQFIADTLYYLIHFILQILQKMSKYSVFITVFSLCQLSGICKFPTLATIAHNLMICGKFNHISNNQV